jgi:hypothetical protein
MSSVDRRKPSPATGAPGTRSDAKPLRCRAKRRVRCSGVFPKAAYMTEIESWRLLPGDRIEFTMRRLPSAD